MNPSTGTMQYSIPIWNVTSHDLSFPISLNYASNPISVGQPSSNVGMGWNLSSEATITRVVKGLPDDLNTSLRKGWLHGKADDVQSFSPNADTNFSDHDDEHVDHMALKAFGDFELNDVMYDTEPDVFFINAPGVGGHFMFNENGEIFFGGDNLYTIEYETNASNQITVIQIKTNSGVTYTFSLANRTRVEAKPIEISSGVNATILSEQSDYYHYGTEEIEYVSKWYLSSIQSTQGGHISFEYKTLSTKTGDINHHVTTWASNIVDEVFIYTTDDQFNIVKLPQYEMHYDHDKPKVLQSISSERHTVQFVNGQARIPKQFYYRYTDPHSTEKESLPLDLRQPLVNAIRVFHNKTASSNIPNASDDNKNGGLISHFVFDYKFYESSQQVVSAGTSQAHYPFLMSVTQGIGINYNKPISFEYYNIYNGVVDLPNYGSEEKDLFGYYNATESSGETPEIYIYPELPDEAKYRYKPIPNYGGKVYQLEGRKTISNIRGLLSGVLKKIKTPLGGESSFIYEKNTYYDLYSQKNQYGGGIRVKKVITHDGINHDKDIIINYDYRKINGNSSGKLLAKPTYVQYSGYYVDPATSDYATLNDTRQWNDEEYWKRTIKISNTNNSNDILNYSGVLYERVTQYQTGKGKTVLEFDVPIDHTTVTHALWEPAKSFLARHGLLPGYNYANIDHFSQMGNFSSSMNTSFNYLNGQRIRTSLYNEAGDILSINENSYNYTSLYREIQGIRREIAPAYRTDGEIQSMYVYTPYTIRLETNALPIETISKTYEYNAVGTQKEVIATTENTYDNAHYPILRSTTSTDIEGIEYTTTSKYNQEYSTVAGGSNEQVIALNRMNALGRKMIPIEVIQSVKKPGQSAKISGARVNYYKFLTGDKLISNGSYSLRINEPITNYQAFQVNANETVLDSRMIRDFEVAGTDQWLNVTSLEGRNKTYSATYYEQSGRYPIIEFSGATQDEVAYANFEQMFFTSNPEIMGFSIPFFNTVDGRTAGTAIIFETGKNISAQLNRRSDNDTYLISFWYKNTTSGAIGITLQVNDNSISQTSNWDLPTTSGWKYSEKEIDVSALGTSLEYNLAVDANDIVLDDLIFAPSSCLYSYITLDERLRKVADTNHKGLSNYYEYDELNRPTIVRNDKGFIISAHEYSLGANDLTISPSIHFDGRARQNEPETFKILNIPDPIGYTFEWKWMAFDKYGSITESEGINTYDDIVTNSLTYDITFDSHDPGKVYVVYLKTTTPDENVYHSSIIIDGFKIGGPSPVSAVLCIDGPDLLDRCPAEEDGPDVGGFFGNCDLAGTGDILFEVTASGGSGNYTYEWIIRPGHDHQSSINDIPQSETSSVYSYDREFYNNDFYLVVKIRDTMDASNSTIEKKLIQYFESTPHCGAN